MAYANVYLTNDLELKKVPVGYSWTVLFFGPFVSAIRGDWPWAVGLLVGNLLSYGIFGIVMSFLYNKIYMKSLFSKGYRIHDMGGVSDTMLKNWLGFVKIPGRE